MSGDVRGDTLPDPPAEPSRKTPPSRARKAPVRGKPKPSTKASDSRAQEVGGKLGELKRAENFTQKYLAVGALSRMHPIEQWRSDVTQAVEPLMRDSNAGLRDAAIRAMGVWGTTDNVPSLLKLLEQVDRGTRMSAMEALGRIPDERSAKALAKWVVDTSSRNKAAMALKRMGPVAEDAVIGLLADGDHQVRYQACNILGEIGGAKSIEAIAKRLETDQHVWSRAAAEIALRKLKGKRAATGSSFPAPAQHDSPALCLTGTCFVNDLQRQVGVVETRGIAHETGHGAVELAQQLFADGALAFERFLVAAGFVEPDQGIRQIDKGDSALAGDLQRRRRPIGHGLLPRRGHVAPTTDLGGWPAAGRTLGRIIEAHHLVVVLNSITPTMSQPDDRRRRMADDITAPVDQFHEVAGG
jgi:hypothetical protein